MQKMVVDFYKNIESQIQQSDTANYIFVNCDRGQCRGIENRECQPLKLNLFLNLKKHENIRNRFFSQIWAKKPRNLISTVLLTCWNSGTNHCNNLFKSLFFPMINNSMKINGFQNRWMCVCVIFIVKTKFPFKKLLNIV